MSWNAHLEVLCQAGIAEPEGRYLVMEAWCTGADEYARKDTLVDALDLRDQLRKERPSGRTGPIFFVCDGDDPERGWLEHDDLYEEASA